ncbi:MAG: ROK family protein [Deltaproteobacteria bacterium]|nr:ROK family protein [Deltaproteobacteria bacterium]
MADAPVDVGVELGGTKIVVASSPGDAQIDRRLRIPTGSPVPTLEAVRDAIVEVAAHHPIRGIGIASFGPLDLRSGSPRFGTLIRTPKPEWSGVDVVRGIAPDDAVPVRIDTDVAGALMAEHAWGAAQGRASAYITVGTGIGAAIMVDGVIVTGANHSEIGHVRVPRHPDDPYPGRCPYHGDCLEGMACGPAVEERFGRPPHELSGGSREDAVELVAWYLAHGITSMASVVPVDVVVIGGGVAKFPGLHDTVSDACATASGGYPPVPFAEGGPEIVAPGLGDDAGVLGAILLARAAAGEG